MEKIDLWYSLNYHFSKAQERPTKESRATLRSKHKQGRAEDKYQKKEET